MVADCQEDGCCEAEQNKVGRDAEGEAVGKGASQAIHSISQWIEAEEPLEDAFKVTDGK